MKRFGGGGWNGSLECGNLDKCCRFSDPGISTCVEELFAVMAATPGCLEGLHSRFLPTAVHVLQSPEAQLPAGILCVSGEIEAVDKP